MEDDSEAEGLADSPIKAHRCPYATECDYHGVFLYEKNFKEHMEKFHKGERSADKIYEEELG